MDDLVKFEMNLDPPTNELEAYAKEHLNEDPDTKLQVLAEFRDLIFERGECSPHRLDDDFLMRFLRARNFVIRRAHRLLVNYYEFKEKNPEFYQDVYFDRLTAIGDAELISTQPFHDQNGRRMLFYRLGHWDPAKISIRELFQATLLALELALLETSTQILGGVCLFDLADLKMKHVTQLNSKIAAQMIDIVVWTYPLRTHEVHIVNQSPVFKAGYSIVKPFMSKEVRKRIFFHGSDMKSLHKHIDPKYLPVRYGGNHPDYSYGGWVDYIRQNQSVLSELRDLGYTLEDQLNEKSN